MSLLQNQLGLVFPISIANGGTNSSSAIGANGTLAQSNGTSLTYTSAKYPSTSILGKLLRGDGTDWLATTASYPDSIGANQLLYSTSVNAIGSLTAGSAAVLTCNSGGGPSWQSVSDGQVIIGSTAGSPQPRNLTAGSGITITNASNSITISASGGSGGLTWNAVSSSTQALAINNGYYTTYAGLNVMTLPSTAAFGSIISVISGPSGNTFQIAQNAGQIIYYSSQNGVSIATTSGTGGYLQSASPNTIVSLICVVANTTWNVLYASNNDITVN